jgi:hypothetical protein
MKCIPPLLTVIALMACRAPVFSAAAQTKSPTPVKPKSAQGRKVPMRHDQLTLYPHGRPARRQSASSTRATASISRPRSTIPLWACSDGEGTSMEALMRTAVLAALPLLMIAAGGGVAHSENINPSLVGAWTPSTADCSRLFQRTGHGLSFKQPVDKFAQAVIIRPGELEGPSSVCRVLKVTHTRDTITAATECRDTVGYLSLDITIKVQSARQIVYSANGAEALNFTYLKCPM